MIDTTIDNLSIRRYQPTDHDEIWKLYTLTLDAAGANPGPGPWNADLHDIENQYIKNTGDFFVAIIDNKIIGMGGLRKKSDHQAEIKRMRVHPDHQKKGIGQTILNLLEQIAKEL